MQEAKPLADVLPQLPLKITPSQYDKLMRELWELRQRVVVLEKQLTFDTSLDELFKKQAKLERMLIKIGTRIFKKGIS